jgi:uncharacterized membrane protein
MQPFKAGEIRFVRAVGLISGLCITLFIIRALSSGVTRYVFVPENLALAWSALIFAWLLAQQLAKGRWLSWRSIVLSVFWLLFLPNTWYVLTDFIHVPSTGEVSLLFDIVMFSSLTFAGFLLGFASLFLVHKELLKRLKPITSHILVLAVILLASFAIYLGRELRWNTWDIVADPSGIILNVTDRIVDPLGYPSAVNETILFFILLNTLYLAWWQVFGHDSKHKTK